MRLLAVDPGNTESAYVLVDEQYLPRIFGKVPNSELLAVLPTIGADLAVIEMVASYGMAVGAEVFETCVWIGRFYQVLADVVPTRLVKRLPVKLWHCHSAKANDSNIRQALVDRFAAGQPNHGKGTTKAPGWFHGFRADVWAAYALAVYAADMELLQPTAAGYLATEGS
jgi:hypothetical protein